RMARSDLGNGFALSPFFLGDGAAQAAAIRQRSATSEEKSLATDETRTESGIESVFDPCLIRGSLSWSFGFRISDFEFANHSGSPKPAIVMTPSGVRRMRL